MENASKALIIAGAILLSILLISLGIMIFSQAQDTVTNSGMSDAEISSFNNRFIKYEGERKGSVVKTLIQEVIASNANANNASRPIFVQFNNVKYKDESGTEQTDKTLYGKDTKTTVKLDGETTETKASAVLTSKNISTTKSFEVKITGYIGGCVGKIEIVGK